MEALENGVDYGESPLSRFVGKRLRQYKNNRRTFEKKWLANYAAWRRDVSLDPLGPWKKSEVEQEWMSDSLDDITRRKLLAAYGMIRDAATKGGNLAFMFDVDKSISDVRQMQQAQDPQLTAQISAALREGEDVTHDQITRTNGMTEYLRAVFSQLLYGRGWLKKVIEDITVTQVGGGGVFETALTCPAMKCVSVWRMYWDQESGDDPHSGDGLQETRRVSASDLRGMKKLKGFDAAAIDRALAKLKSLNTGQEQSIGAAGAGHIVGAEPPGERHIVDRTKTGELVESWGRHPKRFIEDALRNVGNPNAYRDGEPTPPEGTSDIDEDVEAVVTVACGVVIRVQQTSLRDRPYYTCTCEPEWDTAGESEGIADALHQTQRTRTGIRRAIENNLKLTGNFTAAGKRQFIRNYDETKGLRPGTFLDIDMDAKNVDEAFQQIVFTDISGPLIKAMEFFAGEGDLSSMIPRSEQGLPDGNAPNTAFELRERLEKAGMYLAIAIFNADGMLEGIVRDMLIDNIELAHVNVPVPVTVKALGFTTFQNKTIRRQQILDFLALRREDPEVAGMTKTTWLVEEVLKDSDLAPEQVLKTPEEYQAWLQQQQAVQQQQLALQQQSGGKSPSGDTALEMQEAQARIAQAEANARKSDAEAEAKNRDSIIKTAEAAQRLRSGSVQQPQQQASAPASP